MVEFPAAADSEVVDNAESQEYTLEKIVVVAMLAYDIWLLVVMLAAIVEMIVNDIVTPRASRLSPSRRASPP